MKSIFGILTIIVIITTMPFAFADIAFDQEVKQNIKIEIGKDANVHVIHEIADFGQNSAKLEFLDSSNHLNWIKIFERDAKVNSTFYYGWTHKRFKSTNSKLYT